MIHVAVIQSLQRHGVVHDFVAEYGHVIVDECHHLSAFTFERVLRQVKAKYVLGLTATPNRKDGHHPIIYMQCGSIRFYLSPKKAAQSSPFQHTVIPRLTDFAWERSEHETMIHDIYNALVIDQKRNDLIVKDMQQVLSDGRSPLVLTSRKRASGLPCWTPPRDMPAHLCPKGRYGGKANEASRRVSCTRLPR